MSHVARSSSPQAWPFRETPTGSFPERLQSKENRTGIGRVRECRTIEADKRRRVQHGGVLENFSDRIANNFIGPIERRARRKLKCRDQIASIKLRDESGGRRAQLPMREHDQPAINDQDAEGNSNKASVSQL